MRKFLKEKVTFSCGEIIFFIVLQIIVGLVANYYRDTRTYWKGFDKGAETAIYYVHDSIVIPATKRNAVTKIVYSSSPKDTVALYLTPKHLQEIEKAKK